MGELAQAPATVDVEDLAFGVVGAAASLLEAVHGTGDENLPVRAFATTMCRTVAHLVEVEQTSLALADDHLSAVPEARDELLIHARAAWRRARAALGSATMLGDPLRSTHAAKTGNAATVAPPLFALLGLCERIATALTILEPPRAGAPPGAALSRLRGTDVSTSGAPGVIGLPDVTEAPTVVDRRRKAWWADASL
jgi:hypothetical protein